MMLLVVAVALFALACIWIIGDKGPRVGKPVPAEAASELALARAEMREAQIEHNRNWDAFTASGRRIRAAQKRIDAAREHLLDEAEAWALASEAGIGDGGTAC